MADSPGTLLATRCYNALVSRCLSLLRQGDPTQGRVDRAGLALQAGVAEQASPYA